jgi:hypothetical protein
MTLIAVTQVRPSRDGRYWFIRDDQAQTYTTRDVWVASLCRRSQELQVPIDIDTRAGWAYREIDFARLPDGTSSKQADAPLPKGA